MKNSKEQKNKQKVMVTFYMPNDLEDELDILCHDLKRKKPRGERKEISKSRIVTIALKMLLDDFAENRENSALVKQLGVKL